MGLDLSLIMDICPYLNKSGYPPLDTLEANKLRFSRSYELFELIKGLETHKLKGFLNKYNDEGLTEVREDPYGSPLTWTEAKNIGSLYDKINENQNISDWNKSIVLFFSKIDPEIPVILWWS